MNRVGLGLAIGAGYVLGRTRKLKLALAVGGVVAGKRMRLSPRAVADLVSQQLQDNPQFKEIGDQLREDLRGVGQAASGALVERRLDALADRLHGRTADVRDKLSDAVPTPDSGEQDEEEAAEAAAQTEEETEGEAEEEEPRARDEEPSRKGTAKRASAQQAARKPTQKASTKKASTKKTAARKTAAGRTAPRKTAEKRSGTARGGRARQSKGGAG
ncbi:DNA primase [Streptomyces ferrugineus]|uniref:DNA primase n=1 Tax=Streptomyces ferrugineus TaxID=1413221 RepID=A0A7M2SY81_9ACTN|nr:DNA primase [Streptomyces ferrugineus]QOV41370.1 DNA primase [Streptomyces ferrugineus]